MSEQTNKLKKGALPHTPHPFVSLVTLASASLAHVETVDALLEI